MYLSEKSKALYGKDSVEKQIRISFPRIGLEFTNKDIVEENSFYMKESVMESSNVEFVGCISSYINVNIANVSADLKDEFMEMFIRAEGAEEIPLFHGNVSSALMNTQKNCKKLVAYDPLFKTSSIDVSDWYNNLTFPVTLRALRDSLFDCIGIRQAEAVLPNDWVTIQKEYAPKTFKALSAIKSLCQINGVFGIINRDGLFEYRVPKNLKEGGGAYPGATLFPPFYPGVVPGGGEEKDPHYITYYKNVEHQEYKVNPVDRVVIRQSDNDEGVSYGDGENTYIIQGNMFTLNLDEAALLQIAANIYLNVQGIEFYPFKSDNNGLPFIECGKDAVAYYVLNEDGTYSEKSFYVFSRELKGIQALRDSFSAKGEKDQRKFITDLKVQLDSMKQDMKNEVQQYTYTKDQIDKLEARIKALEEKVKNMVVWESVPELPADAASHPNTYYAVQGEVVVK